MDNKTTGDLPAAPNRRLFDLFRLLLAFLLSLGFVWLVLWGGWSLGLFLAVLLTELVFLAWLYLPLVTQANPGQADMPARRYGWTLQVLLAAVIIDLAFCYVLYDNPWLKLLNFPIMAGLCLIQYLMAARVFPQDWDQPSFWLESLISGIVRPFSCLPDFGRTVARLFTRRPAGESGAVVSGKPTASSAGGKILLGLLLALPVLLISGSILATADPVFARIFEQLGRVLANVSLREFCQKIFTALLMLPFIFSFLYSGRIRQRFTAYSAVLPVNGQSDNKGFRIDKTVLITFLTCINLLYLVFAIIQLTYLTGAFRAVLPDNLTYAEYARGGFFELSAISLVNLALMLLSVKGADRRGKAGLAVRAESLLLLAGSLVQWASAMFRMSMYVNAFGLTLLRFFVTAFMLTMLVLFLLVLAKEFRPGFPLCKSFAAVMLAALLILNHVNSDAWIARHNIRHYQEQRQIDLDYFRELSSSAVPAMLQLAEDGEPKVAAAISTQLLRRYADKLENYTGGRWQWFNISQDQARRLLEGKLESLKP